MTLQEKIMRSFLGKVVRKDLAFLVKGGLPVPTYVLEYLLGQYCASDDQQTIEMGIEKVKEVIRNNYVNRADAEVVKGKIRENGRYRIIDKVTVALNEKNDEYQATFANLGLSGVPIGTRYVTQNPKLLSGNGVWCIITIGYIPGEDVKVRWEIQTLKPIQISNIDLQDYISQRRCFTTEEWIDFLMHTVGLNPDKMNRREKFITLARLLPHIENNYNFVELGPKGTGKSHVFQELSPYGVLVSGGDVTSPRLFVSMADTRESVEGLKIRLFTSEEEDKIPELIDRLDDIKDDLVEYGIEFEYKFRDFHDRAITTDDGWRIVPGRGLDIYEKYSPYSCLLYTSPSPRDA